MSSSPVSRRSRLIAALADIDSLMRLFTDDLLCHQGIAEATVPACRHAARHFLIWLALRRVALETVDQTVIRRFLRHDCNCCVAAPASARLRPWRKRPRSPRVMRFVRFLEREGRIKTPGDLDENLSILDEFLEGLRSDGYKPSTIREYRNGCIRLIAWLHLSRIALRSLNHLRATRHGPRRLLRHTTSNRGASAGLPCPQKRAPAAPGRTTPGPPGACLHGRAGSLAAGVSTGAPPRPPWCDRLHGGRGTKDLRPCRPSVLPAQEAVPERRRG